MTPSRSTLLSALERRADIYAGYGVAVQRVLWGNVIKGDPRAAIRAARAAGCRTWGGMLRWWAEIHNRPKGTDEVRPATTKTSDDVHGGDGNSGECNHRAKTFMTEQTRQAPDNNGIQTDEEGQRSQAACAAPGKAEGKPTASNGAGEPDRGANNPADCGDASTTEALPTAEPAEGAEVSVAHADHPDHNGRDNQHRENAQPKAVKAASLGSAGDGCHPAGDSDAEQSALDSASESALDSETPTGNGDVKPPGGMFASKEEAARRASLLSDPAKEVAKILRRLVKAETVGLGEELSPRLSGKKFIKELAGKSYRLARAKREELEIGHVILAVDCSGSCSSCAPDTLAAAYAVANEMPDACTVIIHCNGGGIEGDIYGKALHDLLLPNTRLVINWGDWDAGWTLEQVVRRDIKLLWLDSFGKAGGVRPSADSAKGVFKNWKVPPVKFDGVGTATDTVIALKQCLSSKR